MFYKSTVMKYFCLAKVSLKKFQQITRAKYSMKLNALKIFIVSILTIFLFSSPAFSQDKNEPNIADIIITTSKTHLLLFCAIKNSFTDEMVQGVRNGLPVTFDFYIELEKINSNWLNKTLTELKLQHTLTYDPLREEFQITLPEKGNKIETTPSIEKAMEYMSELNGIKVIERDKLIPDAPYALHVKAKMAEKKLPLNMHYIIPFISLWDFETDWRVIEFRY